jgi:hypothetical protein
MCFDQWVVTPTPGGCQIGHKDCKITRVKSANNPTSFASSFAAVDASASAAPGAGCRSSVGSGTSWSYVPSSAYRHKLRLKASFETRFSLHRWFQGLKPGAFKLWVTTGYSTCTAPPRAPPPPPRASARRPGFATRTAPSPLCGGAGREGRVGGRGESDDEFSACEREREIGAGLGGGRAALIQRRVRTAPHPRSVGWARERNTANDGRLSSKERHHPRASVANVVHVCLGWPPSNNSHLSSFSPRTAASVISTTARILFPRGLASSDDGAIAFCGRMCLVRA